MKRMVALKRGKRLRPVSAKRAAGAEDRRDVRMELFARDRGYCLLDVGNYHPVVGACAGPWTPHHIIKAWKQPPYTLEVLVTLCARHNTWVEDNPPTAHALGLVCVEGETLEECAERRERMGLR